MWWDPRGQCNMSSVFMCILLCHNWNACQHVWWEVSTLIYSVSLEMTKVMYNSPSKNNRKELCNIHGCHYCYCVYHRKIWSSETCVTLMDFLHHSLDICVLATRCRPCGLASCDVTFPIVSLVDYSHLHPVTLVMCLPCHPLAILYLSHVFHSVVAESSRRTQ